MKSKREPSMFFSSEEKLNRSKFLKVPNQTHRYHPVTLNKETCVLSAFKDLEQSAHSKSLIFSFPVAHHLPTIKSLDIIDGIPSRDSKQNIEKEKILESCLKLKFTREKNKWSMTLSCSSIIGEMEYQLEALLNIIIPAAEHHRRIQDSIFDKEGVGKTRRVQIFEDLDYDAETLRLIKELEQYNLNCVARFEELTLKKDDAMYFDAALVAIQINNIVNDFRAVPQTDYDEILNLVRLIESSETFKNDPNIALSYIPIQASVESLKKRALIYTTGVTIDENQLSSLFQELSTHEGSVPRLGNWFPEGSVDKMKHSLMPFLNADDETLSFKR